MSTPVTSVPWRRVLLVCCLAWLVAAGSPNLLADGPKLARANYDLAARWTAAKVGKLVFDTSVAPHWFETSDRFWYSYETPSGRRYYLVDPVTHTRKPLFDNAKMAAMLTNITRIPYDAQHLPLKTAKMVKKDAAFYFEVEVPKEAEIPQLLKAAAAKTDDKAAQKTDGKLEQKADQKTDQKTQGETDKKEQVDKKDEGDKAKTEEKEPPAKTKTLYFEYELATGKLTLLEDFKAPAKKPRWASISPDEKTVIFARGHNLFMMDAASYELALKKADDPKVVETQLTTDGEEHFSYARRLNDDDKKEIGKGEKDRKDPRTPAVGVVWSKDSKKIAVGREDERKVADLWVINALSNPRPTLETYRYAMPGEPNVPQDELSVIDLATKAKTKIKADRFKDQSISIATARVTARARELDKVTPQWLADGTDRLFFTRMSRDMHKVDVCVANPATGDVKVVIEERLNTYIENKPLRLVNGGKQILHWSERDGWGHYYLYDENGTLVNQVTSGEFVSDSVEWVDEKARVLYFTAYGKEGEDPYYLHLFRVNLDGTGLKCFDPGEGSHAVSISDSGKFAVDTFSKVNTAPKSVLLDTALFTQALELETTDVSALQEAGFRFPEPFKVKADDGVTDLYGVMYKPFDFDANKKYPIIAYVYPGPQTESVTKTFSPKNANVALAQFGFIVIEVGNRGGNPQRSKWYHNYGYGNLRDYGLADKKTAIEQLARRNPWVDVDRVGIYGHSGGGFMSTAAMLVYPDFFKVAVSSSGNHENNIYNNTWSEKHHGIKEVADKDGGVKFEYTIDKNSDIAKQLKGRLMLVTGDIDDNVHPAATFRMADALIKANKRFDMLVIPGKRHGYGDATDYFFWVRADYFCKHLLGESADSVDMVELNREKEQKGK